MNVIRRFTSTISQAVRSVVAPAALVLDQAAELAEADRLAADPADTFGEDDMPAAEDIAEALATFHRAADSARAADRIKRKARKILDRLPAGTYGGFRVERIVSSRETPDLEAIRKAYRLAGLGPVPMRSVAPSLRVSAVPASQTPAAAPAAAEAEHLVLLAA